MNSNNQPPYDPDQYEPTVDKGYNDPTQYRPASDSSQDESTEPNQPSTQPPYIPAQPVPSDPYSAPGNGTPVPSDPYQANASGTPPHFTSPYTPNPYLPTPPPPPSAVSPYGKKLFLGLTIATLFSFFLVELSITPDNTPRQNALVLYELGMSILIGITVCVFVIDWRGFFNLEGLIKWRRMSTNRRIGMGCLFYFLSPIFVFIYAIRAGIKAFAGQDRLFSRNWDMPQPAKRRAKIGIVSGSSVAIFFLVAFLFANTNASAQGTTAQNTPATTPTSQAVTSTQNQKPVTPTPTAKPQPTPSPTRQGAFPVCNEKTTNTPCVQYASIQDAAEGNSQPSSNVHTSKSKGIVNVVDDITNVAPTLLGSDTTLQAIQYQCFNIQQGLWYGLESTINTDASQTFRKSPFSEVDITFIDHHKGDAPFASCRLTSSGVDKIDKAGMWDDGDYTGAWSLYDGTSFE